MGKNWARRGTILAAAIAMIFTVSAGPASADADDVATAASRCRFITDYSGNIVRVECDRLA
jgi:hypothetical protein